MVAYSFKPRFVAPILSGTKTQTIRANRKRKHKGQPWADVPGDYLDWMLKQADLDGDAKHWAAMELDRRLPGTPETP